MIKVNDNFSIIPPSYLFSDIAKKVSDFQRANPQAQIVKMGIGDVTAPLVPAVVKAMEQAVRDQSSASSFHGYGPEQGYEFLRQAIADIDYKAKGISIADDEIFVSDGAKSDLGNIGDLLSVDCRVAVTDPVYPVYVDTTAMAGRAGRPDANGCWSRIVYLPCTEANGFVPELPAAGSVDVIYLCYPNNPTGTTLSYSQLQKWVDYALENDALILYDSAYEAYISQEDVPHSIYEIPGAKRCAIEFRSFSKTAGFTGIRLGYTVVPHQLEGVTSAGEKVSLRAMWLRRQTTKFNGASYISQRAGEAIYTVDGQAQIKQVIAGYMNNAEILRKALTDVGLTVYGGVNAPYIWCKTPRGMSSWQFFGFLLEKLHLVVTPGVGFGPSGEGFVRLTAFSSKEATLIAAQRLNELKNIL